MLLNSGNEELFISMGTAYILAAAMKFFKMSTLSDAPGQKFPKTEKERTQYIEEVFGEFVDCYVLQRTLPRNAESDFIMNYGLSTIFLTILLLQLKDTAKEGDGNRNLINQKLLLSVFKSLGAYSKYAIEMFVSIAQIECLLTPRLAEQCKWGSFVNWRGGEGNNMEDDLAQEVCLTP